MDSNICVLVTFLDAYDQLAAYVPIIIDKDRADFDVMEAVHYFKECESIWNSLLPDRHKGSTILGTKIINMPITIL